MNKKYCLVLSLLLVVLLASPLYAQQRPGQIFGKITMRSGDEYTGRIIWGYGEKEHETIWNHTFDATYDFYDHYPEVYDRQRERGRNRFRASRSEFCVFFGNIAVLERDRNGAIIQLKDGRRFEVSSGDCGETITVIDTDMVKIRVVWRDMETVEFMDEPADYTRNSLINVYPLFGAVTTNANLTLTGFVLWDNDESLSNHILNGNERRERREIPFGRIRSITPLGRRSSEIELWTGRKIVLSGTNDVNSDNRGLIIADKNYGIAEIEWRDIETVVFERNVAGMRYSDFKAGKPLYGTLTDDRGEEHTGFIRWDDDENITTDFLNGEYNNVTMKLEFSNIAEIRRRSRNSAVAVLKNGQELLLRKSNDINYRNRGIVVLKNSDDPDGQLFEWDEFEKVVFRQ